MWGFTNNEQKQVKIAGNQPVFYYCKICHGIFMCDMGYSCAISYILFYDRGPAISRYFQDTEKMKKHRIKCPKNYLPPKVNKVSIWWLCEVYTSRSSFAAI